MVFFDNDRPRYISPGEMQWLNGASKREARRRRAERLRNAKRLGNHTRTEWRGLCAYFGGRCVKCLRVLGPIPGTNFIEYLEKDHIVRIVDGGSNSLENVQPLCNTCHVAKVGPDPTDYRPRAAARLGLAWPLVDQGGTR